MSRRGGANVRRFFALALLFVLLFVFLVSATTAAGAVISIPSAELKVGESRTLTILLADTTEEISCATITVSYDPAILKVTAVQNSTFDKLVYSTDTAQGKTTIVLYQIGASGLTGTIALAELTFEAVKAGSSSMQLRLETLKNNAGVTVAATVQPGSVTVKADGGSDGTPTPSPSTSPTLTPSPSPSPAGGGGGGGSGGSSGGMVSPSPSPSPSLSPASSPSAPVTTAPSPSPVPTPDVITVRIGDLTVASGEVMTATIRIEGLGGDGLRSALIALTYNPKIVKVLAVTAETSDFEEFSATSESGAVQMIGYQTGAERLTDDVTFAQLQLKGVGKPGEQTALGLDVIALIDMEGQMLVEHQEFQVLPGSLTITAEDGRKRIPSCGLAGFAASMIGAYILLRRRRDR